MAVQPELLPIYREKVRMFLLQPVMSKSGAHAQAGFTVLSDRDPCEPGDRRKSESQGCKRSNSGKLFTCGRPNALG